MNLRENLEQTLGLVISNDWYDDCVTALQQQQRSITTADMIFEQMLYHDLRDVVRGNHHRSEMNGESQPPPLPTPAQLLRNAVTASMQQNASKETLPSSFRCCLQIEEICDVSKNSESRFTTTTISSTSCLKFCLIDGYYPGQPMVAMEVTSIIIPGASSSGAKLLPGTKLLLFGPVIVRNGMMGIHHGNCIILGGHVERLIQIQQQAMETAKQRSGHGIDPTIRALIWNNRHNDGIDENEGDEGEQESSDVAPVQPMTVTPPPLPPIVPAQVHAPVLVPPLTTQPTIQRRPYPSIVATPAIQAQPNDHRFHADRHVPTTAMTAAGNSTTTIQNIASTIAPTVLPINRYITTPRIHPTASNTSTAPVALPLTRFGPNTGTSTASNNPPSIDNCHDAVMTYSQFYDFMKRIVKNEQEYVQAMNKTYKVGPMQQIGPKLYFNIEKASKRHKPWHDIHLSSSILTLSASSENKQQLEYVMLAKFGIGNGTNSQDHVTCRISSAILEPHFPVSATELRKLSKTDKPKSDSIVRDCGKIAQQCLYQLQIYEVVLNRSVEEMFHSADHKQKLDGNDPFLFLKLKFDT